MFCSRARLSGYMSALEEKGILHDSTLIREGDFRTQSGYEQAMSLLRDVENRPTAIFGGSGLQCMGVYEAARQLGLRIPEDLSVVGFDDIQTSEFMGPPLTTVSSAVARNGIACHPADYGYPRQQGAVAYDDSACGAGGTQQHMCASYGRLIRLFHCHVDRHIAQGQIDVAIRGKVESRTSIHIKMHAANTGATFTAFVTDLAVERNPQVAKIVPEEGIMAGAVFSRNRLVVQYRCKAFVPICGIGKIILRIRGQQTDRVRVAVCSASAVAQIDAVLCNK